MILNLFGDRMCEPRRDWSPWHRLCQCHPLTMRLGTCWNLRSGWVSKTMGTWWFLSSVSMCNYICVYFYTSYWYIDRYTMIYIFLIKWEAKELLRVSEPHAGIRTGFTHVMGKDLFICWCTVLFQVLNSQLIGLKVVSGFWDITSNISGMYWILPSPGCLQKGSTVSSCVHVFWRVTLR